MMQQLIGAGVGAAAGLLGGGKKKFKAAKNVLSEDEYRGLGKNVYGSLSDLSTRKEITTEPERRLGLSRISDVAQGQYMTNLGGATEGILGRGISPRSGLMANEMNRAARERANAIIGASRAIEERNLFESPEFRARMAALTNQVASGARDYRQGALQAEYGQPGYSKWDAALQGAIGGFGASGGFDMLGGMGKKKPSGDTGQWVTGGGWGTGF